MLVVAPERETDVDDPAEPTPGSKRRREDQFDMDITPMIDMTFLLLIFFLVASTPDEHTAIELPNAQHGVGVSQLDAVVFTIGEGGLGIAPLYAADGRVAGAELPDDLEARRSRVREIVEQGVREDKTNVVIKGDKNVAHRDVSRLIKAVSQVSGIKIYLAVLESQ